MKVAIDHNGNEITAGPGAPTEAICPACRSTVDLRVRTTASGLTWYWRHPANANLNCPRRSQAGRDKVTSDVE